MAQRRPEAGAPRAACRAVFGRDLARLFTWHDGEDVDGFGSGVFVIGGQELTLRWMDNAEPYDCCYQTPAICGYCDGPAWLRVNSAKDLLDATPGMTPIARTAADPLLARPAPGLHHTP